MIGEKPAFLCTVLILPQTYSKELRRTSKVTGSSRLPFSFEVFIGTPSHRYGQIAFYVDYSRSCRRKRSTRMLVFDYRRPLDLMAGAQRRGIINRGPDGFAVEDHFALAFDYVSRTALPGGRGSGLRTVRSMSGHHARRSHAQADESRLELLRRAAIFAQMRLMEIGPDFVERRFYAVRNRRQDLVALSDVTHLCGAPELYRGERESF